MTQPGWTPPGTDPPPEPPRFPSFQGGFPAPAHAASALQPRRERDWLDLDPGIVPLRPLTLGDVLGGAVGLIRFNAGATLGLTLLAQGITMLLALPIALLAGRGLFQGADLDGTGSMGSVVGLYLAYLPTVLANVLLVALLASVTQQAVLGRRITLAETWRAGRRRSFAFLGAVLALSLAYAAVAGGVLLALRGSDAFAAAVAVLVLAQLGVTFVLGVRLLFVAPAMVLERCGVVAAAGRSWRLTRGRFWPIVGTVVLAGLMASFASSILQTPIQVAIMVLGILVAPNDPAASAAIMVVGSVVGSTLAQAVVTPFSAGVTHLLYLDARMRQEGLDITLVTEVGAAA